MQPDPAGTSIGDHFQWLRCSNDFELTVEVWRGEGWTAKESGRACRAREMNNVLDALYVAPRIKDVGASRPCVTASRH